jgi:hypothetical protein
MHEAEHANSTVVGSRSTLLRDKRCHIMVVLFG